MDQDSGLDGRYVGFREYAALSDRVTRMEGRMEALLQLPAQVQELTATVRALSEKLERPSTDGPMTGAALAMNRLAAALERPAVQQAAGWPLSMQQIVVIVMALLVVGALLGGAVGVERLFGAAT